MFSPPSYASQFGQSWVNNIGVFVPCLCSLLWLWSCNKFMSLNLFLVEYYFDWLVVDCHCYLLHILSCWFNTSVHIHYTPQYKVYFRLLNIGSAVSGSCFSHPKLQSCENLEFVFQTRNMWALVLTITLS